MPLDVRRVLRMGVGGSREGQKKMKLGKQKSFNMAQNCGFMIARAWRLNRNIVLGGAALIFCTVGSSLLELFVVPAVLESVGPRGPLPSRSGTGFPIFPVSPRR